MARDLVRDPDELDDEEQPRVARRYPNLPPRPDITPQTLPTTAAAPTPPAQVPLSEQIEKRRETLKGKLAGPGPEATRWQRFGHTLNVIGQDVGAAVAPGIIENIPGSIPNRRRELGELTQLQGVEQEREAHAQREKEQTALQERGLGIEEKKAGMPRMLPPAQETVRTDNTTGVRQNLWEIPGQPAQWVDEGGYPEAARPLPPAGVAGVLPTTGAQPTPPPPPPEGTLPRAGAATTAAPPPMGAPTAAQAPRYTYGKPAEGKIPLTEPERQQINAEAASFFKRLNPTGQVPSAYQLPPGANKEDAASMREMLTKEEAAAATQAQRAETNRAREAEQRRAQETLDIRKEEAAGKWLRAVDNDDKVHYITRGDYEANQRNFKPNPGILPPGSIEKATDHNTVINEMQGRMNAVAESAQAFNWKDTGQKNLVIQAMQRVDEMGYADKVIGIPIMDFIRQNMTKLGLSGATPQTREYIIDLLSLREAMLGMPKEITGGSRMMEKAIEALYSTLPSGVTPDRAWAMTQLLASQSIMDRLRGSRVPILEGMHTVQKIPDLYQHSATGKNGERIFSDDRIHWFDENGKRVR